MQYAVTTKDTNVIKNQLWQLLLPLLTPTRKRAIAKTLQLEGHPDFAPVDLAYYQHFLGFFLENIAFWEVPPGNHKCRSRGATPLVNVKYATNSHRFRSQSALSLTYAVTLTFDPLTLNHVLAVTC